MKVFNSKNIDARPKRFVTPVQVAFIEREDKLCDSIYHRWLGGIAYGDRVICGECGIAVPLTNIETLVILEWVDLSDTIIGDIDLSNIGE